MSMKVAKRLELVKPSATFAMAAEAAALRAQGRDIVDLSAGEPDFDTPAHIKAAAAAALDKGVSKYTEVGGILPLRKAVAAELSAVHKTTIEPDQILVSSGAKHSLYNLFMALIDPGDEVLIPAPYWVSFPDIIKYTGATPVYVQTSVEDGFAVKAEAIEKAITPRTRLLILNSPSNPTGGVTPSDEYQKILAVCK